MSDHYELLVVGSGPAGQKAAIQAAKLRKRVALVERRPRRRRRLGQHRDDPVEDDPRGDPLPHRPEPAGDLRPGLPPEGRDLRRGHRARGRARWSSASGASSATSSCETTCARRRARRASSTRTRSPSPTGGRRAAARRPSTIVLAVGSAPAHPPEIEFNGRTILDSDDIVLRLETIPRRSSSSARA